MKFTINVCNFLKIYIMNFVYKKDKTKIQIFLVGMINKLLTIKKIKAKTNCKKLNIKICCILYTII